MSEYIDEQTANIKTESKAEILEDIKIITVGPSNLTSHAARKPPIFCDGDVGSNLIKADYCQHF